MEPLHLLATGEGKLSRLERWQIKAVKRTLTPTSAHLAEVTRSLHAVPIDAPLRVDAVQRSLPVGEALSQAPESEASGLAVPKVLEGGE